MNLLALAITWYSMISLLTFGAFLLDKRAAVRGSTRISERTLHTFEAMGGWPGALIAVRTIRHKNRRRGYRLILWAITIVHVAAWIGAVRLTRS